ncbi:MAG: hypothetical protein GY943_21580, partial [Chloroflexi bacterium]|nr:hypothetical protein [Chloroflexota bacterium]
MKLLTILTISILLFTVACGNDDKPEVTLATTIPEPTEPSPTSTAIPEPTEPSPIPTSTPILESENVEEHIEAAAKDDANDETSVESFLMGKDINRAPGHSIGFEQFLEPDSSHQFLFLASPGDTISATVSSASNMLVGIVNAKSSEVLDAAPSGDGSLVVDIPENALYHIVIEDASGQGGDYTAVFEASPKVSFALDANYFIIGRLPEGELLYYTYTASPGAILQGNVIPHPDTPVDFVVTIRDLDSQAILS